MTHVVTEACIRCKYTDCVDVCPVDAFREGPNFLVINPDECIDCGLCVPECPIDAILDAKELPVDQTHWIEVNGTLSQSWPTIVRKKPAAPDAEHWATIRDKLALIER